MLGYLGQILINLYPPVPDRRTTGLQTSQRAGVQTCQIRIASRDSLASMICTLKPTILTSLITLLRMPCHSCEFRKRHIYLAYLTLKRIRLGVHQHLIAIIPHNQTDLEPVDNGVLEPVQHLYIPYQIGLRTPLNSHLITLLVRLKICETVNLIPFWNSMKRRIHLLE